MKIITEIQDKATKTGGFLPAKFSAQSVRHLPGDDRLDIDAIMDRIRDAVRTGRADVAETLARFAASIVRQGARR